MLYAAEYKRRQAPPGVKITRKSFGRDRRYPLTNAFRERCNQLSMPPNAWSRRTAVGLVLLAAALAPAARVIAGPRGALVHVRWQPSVTAADRQALEQRFHLADGELLDAARGGTT